ncbi:25S rRNA (adenine645-N1)-methyltransferase [Entomophthora muscae]|uniref:25S rRNA (Adenine645-N1)-methyltransferase n=1 Tax=Entomophthora muscae TaxID=34485 RepID=A0ACC2UIC6_9FUNG|nr:25S rRNA (adenine645-N1)-methyltransferase [Entomophthora muscae]
MSKPLFNINGWNMPTIIAKETSAKSSIGKAGVKREQTLSNEVLQLVKQLSGKESTGSAKSTTEKPAASASNSGEGSKKSKKKPKKRSAQELNNSETPLLNLGAPEQKAKEVETSKNPAPKKQAKKAKTTASGNEFTPLQQKMNKQLQGAKFRMINEMLYTMPGDQAFKKFQKDPDMFEEYHSGFRTQVESWPANPVDVFIKHFKENGKPGMVIADMGCGEAELALKVPDTIKVHSFDLVAANPRITACDIAHTPLPDSSVDAVVFSLSLMGTNYHEFIAEAYRILKSGGEIKIAEVISRFDDINAFISYMNSQEFHLSHRDESNKMFVMLDFIKDGLKGKAAKKAKKKSQDRKAPLVKEAPVLKPCIYKRR